MKKLNQWHVYFLYIALFFFLNILNTYMLTVQRLNRYIAPFPHTLNGDISAFLGNFSALFIATALLFAFIKKAKARMFSLLVLTLFLNIFIFGLGIFNMFFGTAFSIPAATIFNNPADGFAMGTFLTALLEIITYYRIVVFLPFIILLLIYLLSDRVQLKTMQFRVTAQKALSALLLVSMTLFTSVSTYFDEFQKTMPINSVKSTFAIQTLGVYPFYLGEIFGKPFDVDLIRYLDLDDDETLRNAFSEYNKNQASYTNFIDGNTYSNRLNEEDAIESLWVDPDLIKDDSLHGLLKGRNLVLIHLESLNTFLLEEAIFRERFRFLNALLSQSFYFSEFYNNVGMGVSSDAELSVLTGLHPMGDRNLYWELESIQNDLDSLPLFFKQAGYHTLAIHGDYQTFYNRDYVYPNLYQFDAFHSIETFIEQGYDVQGGYLFDPVSGKTHHSPWLSDFHLADYTFSMASQWANRNDPFMIFSVTMMPHTPYEFDPYGDRTDVFPQFTTLIQTLTMRYINYIDYVDQVIERFFKGPYQDDRTLDQTVYVFYSDHGSGIKNGDLDVLLNQNLSVIETRKHLQKVPAWIYVPSHETIDLDGIRLNKGMITGEQTLVRGQTDLYRTILELFDLDVGNSPYFGVHGLSKEPTFAMENRLMDVALDAYFFSMRDPKIITPIDQNVSDSIFYYIKRFKMLSDILVTDKNSFRNVERVLK